MTRLIFICSVILLFCMVACSNKKIIKYDSDSGSTCTLSPRDTLEIVLKSNPTTGYEWKLTSLDTAVMKNIAKDYISDKVPGHTMGSGGRSIFSFVAVHHGSTRMKMIYHRSFEKDVAPVRIFTLRVKVR
ncbi:MAG: protease inhibitor I42 family protein [bacterium]